MAKATGIGGIFFRGKDKQALTEWYKEHFGMDCEDDGSVVWGWRDLHDPSEIGQTIWSVFDEETEYFGPGEFDFMVNLRVDDMDALLAQLRDAGVEVVKEPESFDYGRFAWVEDPEGHRIELWEPPEDAPFDTTLSSGEANPDQPTHVGARPTLGVRDVVQSAAFYREVLQFDLDVIQEEPASYALLSNGGAEIALNESLDPAVADFAAIYIETSDVRGLYERCRNHDAEIVVDISGQPWGTTNFVVVDPDGHRIAVGETDA